MTQKKFKICSPQLGLNPNSDLGGEVHDHHIIQMLAKRGHKVFVYLPKGRPYQLHKNIIVSRAPIKHIPAIFFNFLVLPYLFSLYSKEKFQILRVHNPYFVGPAAVIFKLLNPQVKIVVTYHLKERNFLFDVINRFLIPRFDAIITVSEYLKKWLVTDFKADPNKIYVNYNGVDKNFRKGPKNLLLLKKYKLKNKIILLFMGLLIERKNPLFLLKVFKEIQKVYPQTALLIAGRGSQEGKLKEYVTKNSQKNIIFTNTVFGKEKIDLINTSDIFVLPSKNEGFGLVIAEAMACAKPVVITSGWSAREAVTPGIDGYLAKENDIDDWVKKISILIENKDLRNKIGANAEIKAQAKFTWSNVAAFRENIYNKILS